MNANIALQHQLGSQISFERKTTHKRRVYYTYTMDVSYFMQFIKKKNYIFFEFRKYGNIFNKGTYRDSIHHHYHRPVTYQKEGERERETLVMCGMFQIHHETCSQIQQQ